MLVYSRVKVGGVPWLSTLSQENRPYRKELKLKGDRIFINRRNHRKYTRSPNYEHVIQENCINAYVDGGNSIQAMWQYLKRLIELGDITEPFAKEQANKALNTIKSAERMYNKLMNK